MNAQTPDFEDARQKMVDGQVRPNKVTDPRIVSAMRFLPRERFLPPQLAPLAYVDEDVPLGQGRVLMEPMVLARLVQAARPVPGDRALVVGAGTGYGAAVLAFCGARVTALEEDESLTAIARRTLAELVADLPTPVRVVSGPLAEGWTDGGPWDVILIEGAVAELPPVIGGQLRRDGGRLATVLRSPRGICHGVLAEPVALGGGESVLRAAPEFDCATPLLPQLMPKPGFVF